MSKLNLCVIFGGASSEHEVSLLSAESVLRNIFISKKGEWYYYDGADDCLNTLDHDTESLDRAIISPDTSEKAIIRFTENGITKHPIDVVFPVLHGKNGEDGTIQGLFELAGIPYVGTGVIGSAVCMDKCVAKAMFARAGIPQADWVELKRGENKIAEIEEKLGYPCFVKPSNAGSSVGITKAHNRSELESGIETAFKEDYKILVERMMTGTEVESSVIGNTDPVCAPFIHDSVKLLFYFKIHR